MICALTADVEHLLGTDAEIARLKKRDPDALASLIARYQHRLYRYLVRLVRDPATADDLFQQTWLRVMEKIRQYDASRSFDAWLDEPKENGAPAQRLPSVSPSALEQYLKSERIAKVMRGMAALPAIHREVLTLRFEEELKLEEIAQLTGTPLATAASFERGDSGVQCGAVVAGLHGGVPFLEVFEADAHAVETS